MSQTQEPTAVLRDEHQTILRVLGVLGKLVERAETGSSFETASLRECVEFFRLFADACHHAKEEDLLFPVLEKRGIPRENGPIGMMLYEHTLARGFTKDMGEALDAHDRQESDAAERFLTSARQYVELLTNHIFKEDNVLFNMGDGVMTAEDRADLCGKFCEVQCGSFGGKKREELERMADALETRWCRD